MVGYSKLTMKADGYTLIANPFGEVGTGDVIGINEMFAEDTTAATAGTSVSDADSLEVWTGTGYKTYYLRADATAGNHWRKSGERKATTDEIPEGDGAFFHNVADHAVTLTISGEVSPADSVYTVYPGYNLMANPFPTSLSFRNFVVDGATAGTSVSDADSIEVWTGNGYKTYYLRADATAGNHWRKSGERKETTDTIDPYTGFFYHCIATEGSFNVTIPSPLSSGSSGQD